MYVDEKRYYRFDLSEILPILDDAVPFFFRYDGFEIYESSWNKMALGILESIDRRNPKSSEELLALQYCWSKTAPFSLTKRTNYTPFKGIYLNTNHTSTHSMMSIQRILEAYGIDAPNVIF